MKFWRKPLDIGQISIPHGTIYILKERCKGCGFCVEYCPQDVLEISDEFNAKGYHPPRVKDDAGCLSCGLCDMLCPEFAIYQVEDERGVSEL